MAAVKAILNKSYTKDSGECAVYVVTHVHSSKVRFNSGVSVPPEQWDEENGRVKGTNKLAKDKNYVIDACTNRVREIFIRYRLQYKELTPALLRAEYKTPSVFVDFLDYMQREIEKKRGLASHNTIKSHLSVYNKLREWRNSIMFSELTGELLNEFHKHLKNKLKNNHNTISKNLKTIKVYINQALREKKIENDPFSGFKIKRISPERIYLEPAELKKLSDVYRRDMLPDNLQRCLRCFLFSCLTGVRISDIKRLRHDMLINNTLVFTPHKTRGFAKVVKIPLIPDAMELIGSEAGLIFRPYTDQAMNRMLKKIVYLCGIVKPVTFHSARHTFATNFLRVTKNIAALQQLLGHTNIKETMIYAHVLQDDIVAEMGVFALSLRQ